MPHPNTNGLVGLIVIESSGNPGHVPAVDFASHDATLGQFLDWLARGHRVHGGESGETTRPLGSHVAGACGRSSPPRLAARFPGHNRPALLAADCHGLDAQLECALTQLRRQIAAA
jgi:hypothetical protein